MESSKASLWPGYHDLYEQCDSKVHQALEYLNGFYKTLSIFDLKVLGLPLLRGVVVTQWTATVRSYVHSFCLTHGFSKLLVRTDKKGETGIYMRGGYLINVSDLDKEVNAILGIGRIVILLEPRSPYQDLYSVNALFTPEEEDLLLEVVGPGFDASDLKRGDISPHETIRVLRPRFIGQHRLNTESVTRVVADAQSYKRSVKYRLVKIGQSISRKQNLGEDQLERLAREYLQSTGQTLLLDNEERYQPIPVNYLARVYQLIADLPERAKRLGIDNEPMVVSMSFFAPDEALAFWDIVWPPKKYVIT